MFDVLIIGGGAAGLSCALILGSAKNKAYTQDKKIGVVVHQKTSHLQTALLNNALGIAPNTKGEDVLKDGKNQLKTLYPHINLIEKEKVVRIVEQSDFFEIITNKAMYTTKLAIIATGYTRLAAIEGLEAYTEAHPYADANKDRIWLKNNRHLIKQGLYVAGTLAGWRSQFAIAAGSGAQVATDILTLWNNGTQSQVHDK